MSFVNKPVQKKDAMQLVTGQPVFTGDLVSKNALVVKILHSPHANAMIEDINTSIAMKVPGIEAIFTYKDVPQNRFTMAGQTYPEPSPHDRLILDQHVRFHGDAVVEGQRKYMGTLWNTYAFYVLYANIDKFDPTKYNLEDCKLTVMDKWLLSKLYSMVKAVDDNLANYKIPEAAKALQEFTDEMSNWYVRRGRERYWVQGETDDKTAAYMTLYTALTVTAKTAAPMIPFMAEAIYRNLVCNVDKTAPESVHLCDFPVIREDLIDKELEKNMDEVVDIVVLGRAARNGSNLKNRQPLNTMYVNCDKKVEGYFIDIISVLFSRSGSGV